MSRVALVVLSLCALVSGRVLAADASLVGQWDFDEPSGTLVVDGSLGGNDCSLVRGVRVPGRNGGGALVFDGSGKAVQCSDAASLGPAVALTIAAWVRVDDPTLARHMRVVSKRTSLDPTRGFELAIHPYKNAITLAGSGTDMAYGTFALGTGWHHVAGVFAGGIGRVYVDGIERTRDASVSAVRSGPASLAIGQGSGGGNGFAGALDEVRLYARALEGSEIASLAGAVQATNHPPIAQDQSVVTQGVAVPVTLGATDEDRDLLAYRLVSSPSHGSISGTPPNVTYTPVAPYLGADAFHFEVDDRRGGTARATVQVTVTSPPSGGDDGLVGHWAFDEAVGARAIDSSGLGHTCALQAPQWDAGRFSTALRFKDGAFANCGNVRGLAVPGAITVAAWIQIADPNWSAAMRIVSKKDVWNATAGYALSYNPALDKLEFLAGGSTIAAALIDLDASWHHVAGAFNGSAVTLYVDGVALARNLPVAMVRPGTTPFVIGREAVGGGAFEGLIDDVRVYARALSDAQVEALSAPIPVTAPASVSLESAMVKVRPRTPPRANDALSLVAARNEFVSFQVVVYGGATGASQVTATLPRFDGPGAIEGADITLYREALMPIAVPSTPGTSRGMWPDGLVPAVDEIAGEARSAFPFDVPFDESRAIWVDVHVPDDAAPGDYVGQVSVGSAEVTASLNVTLTVVDAALPSTPTLATAFLLFGRAVCRAHFGRDCRDASEQNTLVARYERLALEHRITLPNVLGPVPSSSGWSEFEARNAPLLDGTLVSRLRGARMTSAQYEGSHSLESYGAFANHLRARGWLARAYVYTGDEPRTDAAWLEIRARSQRAHAAAADLRTLLTTPIDRLQAHGLSDLIDIVVPPVNLIDGLRAPYLGDQRSTYDAFLARPGKALWLYQSCMSHGCSDRTSVVSAEPGARWPSYMIDVPASRNRAMQWVDFLESATGELYFETANKLSTAWTNQYDFGGNGDGTLFYPGTPVGIGGATHVPLASIRLKLVRLGVQDHEWLQLVARAGDPAFARQVARSLVPSASQVSDDGAAFDEAHRALVQRYLELTAPPPPPPTPEGEAPPLP